LVGSALLLELLTANNSSSTNFLNAPVSSSFSVGVTDAYLHSRLDVNGYAVLAMDLSNQCNRLFPNDRFHQQIANTVYAEHLTGAATDSSDTLTKISFSENGRILSEPDFRFFLLRHSSLYDAMVYSDFISTRFQLSTSQGMHKLHEFLAKMGYPLDECQQPFAFMKPKLRRRLQSQINAHAEAYGLENFEFTSFFRVTGYQSLLSASDTSYAVTALLEFEKTVPGSKNRSPEEEEEAESLQAFNLAFDALSKSEAAAVTLTALSGEGSNLLGLVNGGSLSGTVGLGAGIRLAMTMQRTIMATAASLIERNAITRLSHFRYAYLTCTSQSENQGPGGNDLISSHQSNGPSEEEKRHIFTKPLALTRLAHYLMDIHRENGKWTGAKARPLILMAEKPRTNTYLVVGYVYMETASSFVKNPFGKHFALVAQSMQGTFKFESFDSNIVEVSAADVQRFVEQLHYMMDSL
jgi:cell division control protein 45